jgi:arginase
VNISIILAAYDSGHFHGGCGKGPDALIAGGLADALKLAGHDVEVNDIGKVSEDEQEREIGTGFAVCNAVSGEVRVALDQKRFPIVLAGNCLTSAGAVAGAGAVCAASATPA